MMSLSKTGSIRQNCHPGALLEHLGVSVSVISRETFANLLSALIRLMRQSASNEPVLLVYRTLDDPIFEALLATVQAKSAREVVAVTDADLRENGVPLDDFAHQGFFVLYSSAFSATVFWSDEGEETYRLLQGGWTFEASDTEQFLRLLATQYGLTSFQPSIDTIQAATMPQSSPVSWMLNELVQQLEARNRDVSQTLEEMKHLHLQMLDQERLAAIGQLCSVVAHEIRNPLGLMDLYAKLIEMSLEKLETTSDKKPLQDNLALIRTASQDLERILSELTSYSRPLVLELESCDLCEVIREVAAMYTPKYEESDVRLRCNVPEQPILLMMDRGRFRQALINLVKNALEVSKPGSQVDVVLSPRTNDTQLYTKVYDQGSGVDEKFRQKLFTPYFSTKGNGTGLGLAHTRKIMQAHGGSAELLSSSEHGSAFALILPKQSG